MSNFYIATPTFVDPSAPPEMWFGRAWNLEQDADWEMVMAAAWENMWDAWDRGDEDDAQRHRANYAYLHSLRSEGKVLGMEAGWNI